MQNRLFVSIIFSLFAATGLAQDTVVIKADRFIDGTGAAPVENAVMVIVGDRITAVGPASAVTIPSEARTIDLKGHTILPGLMDCHVHISVLPGDGGDTGGGDDSGTDDGAADGSADGGGDGGEGDGAADGGDQDTREATLSSGNYGPVSFTVTSWDCTGDAGDLVLSGSNDDGLTIAVTMSGGTGSRAVDGGTEQDGIILNGDMTSVSKQVGAFQATGTFVEPNFVGDDFDLVGTC